MVHVQVKDFLDLSWFSSFQVPDTLFSQWSVAYQSKSALESFRFTFTENGNVNLYHIYICIWSTSALIILGLDFW